MSINGIPVARPRRPTQGEGGVARTGFHFFSLSLFFFRENPLRRGRISSRIETTNSISIRILPFTITCDNNFWPIISSREAFNSTLMISNDADYLYISYVLHPIRFFERLRAIRVQVDVLKLSKAIGREGGKNRSTRFLFFLFSPFFLFFRLSNLYTNDTHFT